LGPLPKSAGGWASCSHQFTGKEDAGYQALLADIQGRNQRLNEAQRYGTPGFRPNRQYLREMKRFGVLPASFDPARDPVDVFQTDQAYWRLFWYRPETGNGWSYLD
jgi:hypothetical protein